MPADIVLDESEVTVDAFRLKVKGADIILDSEPRRAGQLTGLRRAVVHGESDVLRLNFEGDYKGGARIEGKLLVDMPVLKVGGEIKSGPLGITAPHFQLEPINLGDTLSKLLSQVEVLHERIERLQIQSMISAEAPHYTQAGWRYCDKCSNLHFAPNQSRSVCPSDKKNHSSSQSGAYILFANKSRYGGQGGWGWCNKCQGLCHGSATLSGHCPAGGAHDRSASPNYLVWATEDNHTGFQAKDFPAQDNWRWCNRCYGLFHGGTPGRCPEPSGGAHQSGGSFNYHLMHS